MSKQSQAKAEQGYNPKPRLPICGECKYFRSDMVRSKWTDFVDEKSLRCSIGGFAVKKMGSCLRHEFAPIVTPGKELPR